MKVKVKFTIKIDTIGGRVWIVKGEEYEFREHENDYYIFKDENGEEHKIRKNQLEEFFEIISDKPKLCEMFGVELKEPFNIKNYEHNPVKINYIDNIPILLNCFGVATQKNLANLIEHPELIEKIVKYTNEQKEIFKALKILGFKYIGKDKSNDVVFYTNKPYKTGTKWDILDGDYAEISQMQNMFPFINWEDNEPFEIPEV